METVDKKQELDKALTKINDSKETEAKVEPTKPKDESDKQKSLQQEKPKKVKKRTLDEKIVDIQIKLKVPRDKNNDFGGFTYRTAEDIEKKIKEFEVELKVLIHMVSEEPINVGRFNYIKSTWVIKDLESDQSTIFSAVAREDEAKKKMDSPQISGSASSYARKKALDGFFMLDNRKDDPDSVEAYSQRDASPQRNYNQPPKAKRRVTKQQLLNYPLIVNDQKTTIGALYSALKEDHQSEHYKNAKKVAKGLNEKEAKVLNALIRSESKQHG